MRKSVVRRNRRIRGPRAAGPHPGGSIAARTAIPVRSGEARSYDGLFQGCRFGRDGKAAAVADNYSAGGPCAGTGRMFRAVRSAGSGRPCRGTLQGRSGEMPFGLGRTGADQERRHARDLDKIRLYRFVRGPRRDPGLHEGQGLYAGVRTVRDYSTIDARGGSVGRSVS